MQSEVSCEEIMDNQDLKVDIVITQHLMIFVMIILMTAVYFLWKMIQNITVKMKIKPAVNMKTFVTNTKN